MLQQCGVYNPTVLHITPCSPHVEPPFVTTQCCDSITDYIPFAVPFSPVCPSFLNWKPVSPTPCHHLSFCWFACCFKNQYSLVIQWSTKAIALRGMSKRKSGDGWWQGMLRNKVASPVLMKLHGTRNPSFT